MKRKRLSSSHDEKGVGNIPSTSESNVSSTTLHLSHPSSASASSSSPSHRDLFSHQRHPINEHKHVAVHDSQSEQQQQRQNEDPRPQQYPYRVVEGQFDDASSSSPLSITIPPPTNKDENKKETTSNEGGGDDGRKEKVSSTVDTIKEGTTNEGSQGRKEMCSLDLTTSAKNEDDDRGDKDDTILVQNEESIKPPTNLLSLSTPNVEKNRIVNNKNDDDDDDDYRADLSDNTAKRKRQFEEEEIVKPNLVSFEESSPLKESASNDSQSFTKKKGNNDPSTVNLVSSNEHNLEKGQQSTTTTTTTTTVTTPTNPTSVERSEASRNTVGTGSSAGIASSAYSKIERKSPMFSSSYESRSGGTRPFPIGNEQYHRQQYDQHMEYMHYQNRFGPTSNNPRPPPPPYPQPWNYPDHGMHSSSVRLSNSNPHQFSPSFQHHNKHHQPLSINSASPYISPSVIKPQQHYTHQSPSWGDNFSTASNSSDPRHNYHYNQQQQQQQQQQHKHYYYPSQNHPPQQQSPYLHYKDQHGPPSQHTSRDYLYPYSSYSPYHPNQQQRYHPYSPSDQRPPPPLLPPVEQDYKKDFRNTPSSNTTAAAAAADTSVTQPAQAEHYENTMPSLGEQPKDGIHKEQRQTENTSTKGQMRSTTAMKVERTSENESQMPPLNEHGMYHLLNFDREDRLGGMGSQPSSDLEKTSRLHQQQGQRQEQQKDEQQYEKEYDYESDEAEERVFPSSITADDVLLGRGGGTNRHNTRFRKLVSEAQPQYVQSRKKEKTNIARAIVATVRSRNGRFLKMHANTKYYVDVGDKQATAKTSQALREGLSGRMREIVKTGGVGVQDLKQTGVLDNVLSFASPEEKASESDGNDSDDAKDNSD